MSRYAIATGASPLRACLFLPYDAGLPIAMNAARAIRHITPLPMPDVRR